MSGTEWTQPVGLINRGLSFERELIERSARGYLSLADIVNNPVGQGLVWISGHGLGKTFFDFFGLEFPPALSHDASNALVVGLHEAHSLPK